jgi:polysaccharide export outer membrane protein
MDIHAHGGIVFQRVIDLVFAVVVSVLMAVKNGCNNMKDLRRATRPSRRISPIWLASFFLVFAAQTSQAQESTTDTRYRIGPGDVLEVRVSRAPELSRDGVRVDQRGMIRMPMWDEDVRAACLTEGELAASVAKVYLKYKKAPHVDVFVKEFQSQPVAVIGAVRGASQFKLQRPVRLSELLSFAGGPSESAGQSVQVIHAGSLSLCDKSANTDGDTSGFVSYNLRDTLHGVPEANPFVRPGDLIQVPNAEQVYVLGNVLRPLVIPLKEPLTVSRAIAMAGGTAPSTKKDKVRIIRQLPGGTQKQEIHIDLTAIEKNKAEDVALMANDVIDVPISGTKSILRSLVGTIGPTVSQLPIRAIP